MTDGLRANLEFTASSEGVETGVSQVKRAIGEVSQAAAKASVDTNRSMAAMGDGAEQAVQKMTRAESAFVQSLQRKIAAEKAAGKSASAYYEELGNQRGLSSDFMRPYLAQLDEVTAKSAAARIAVAQGTVSLGEMGMSAKATAAAMRGVPAQFTDIITSLQGGQRPMTVLLQQGGQLKDMFGGIGNASRALGGYIAGLINPMTLLAATAGVLGYAYYKGSEEADAYTKALILSGNAAGTTSSQLSAMAVNIAKATGTQGAAAEALAQMAQSGRVGSDNLESFTRAAIRFQSATGTAVSETVKQFNELAKSPTEASLKLNETYNYLTASVLRQIKALEDQGKATEAAELAQKAFANTLDTRATLIVANIGTIESAWREVIKVIKGAGDAMLDIGRVQTPSMKLAGVQAELRAVRGQDKNRPTRLPWQPSESDLMSQEANLQEMIRLEKRGAEAAAERAIATAAVAEWNKTGTKYLSDTLKLEQEISAARILGKNAGESQIKIEERVKAIRESYAKKAPAERAIKADAWGTEIAKSYAQSMTDLERIQQSAAASADDLTKSQAALRKSMAAPEWAAYSRQQQEQLIYAASLSQAEEDRAAAHKKQAEELKRTTAEYTRYAEAVRNAMVAGEEKLKTQIQENETIGMTSVQIAQLTRAREYEAAAWMEQKAAAQFMFGLREEEVDNIKRTADALRQLADARLDNAVKKQEQSYWQSFFNSIDQTAHQVWTNVLQGGQDMWSKLRNTAKSVFFDWLYQMTLKKWIFSVGVGVSGNAAMAQSAAGSLGSAGGAGGAGGLGNLAGSLSNYLGPQAMSGLSAAAGAAGFVYAASAAASGKWGDAIGTGIGTAIGGPVGAVIGHVLGSSLDKLTGNTGTKPSIEGGYASAGTQGSANGKNYVDGLYGGQLDLAAKSVVDGVSQTYAKVVQSLGGKAGMLTGQAFLGYDGNGGSKGSQNALSLDAQLNGNWLYNRWTEQGGNLNAGTTSDEMTAAVNVASKQILLKALAATDLGPALNAYLATVITQGKTLTELDATLADVTGFAAFRDAVKSLPFDYLVSASVEAEKALLAAAGGFDSFRDSLGTYIELFYSDAEKAAIKTKSLTAAFASIGVDLPSLNAGTRDWYKALVDSLGAQDLSVEANARAYATALSLASAVNDLAPAMQAAADATAAATDAASQAATQARADAISAAQNALTKSVASERTRLSDMASNRSALVASMQSVVDLLATSATELYAQASGTAMQSAAQGRAAITAALAMAKAGGIVPEQASLSAAIAAARAGLDGAQYSTQFEADRQRLILAGELSQLQAATGTQLSIAEQQLQATQDQLSALDESVRYAQDLVDAANGIDTSVKTVAAALADLVAVLAPAKANTATTAGITSSAGTAAVFGGTSSSAAGESAYTYNPADFGGLSADEYRRSVKGILAALGSVPSYDIGTPFVPTDMLARVHQGEAIIPRAYNPFLAAPGAAGQSNAELAASLRDMATQLAEIKANTASTADATSRGTKVWEGAAQGNLAIATTAS